MIGLTLAATVCFWLSRLLGRTTAERRAGKLGLEATDRWVGCNSAFGILIARLIPGLSFDAVSYAAGLTSIGYWRFCLATLIGTAPQTLLYAYLGQTAPQYAGLMLKITLGALVALVIYLLYRRWRWHQPPVAPHAREAAAKEPAGCDTVEWPANGGSIPPWPVNR